MSSERRDRLKDLAAKIAGTAARARAVIGGKLDDVDFKERFGLRIALASLLVGLVFGFFGLVVGFGVALFGFIVGATLRIDAVFARHAMNQQTTVELQKGILRELQKLNAGIEEIKKGKT